MGAINGCVIARGRRSRRGKPNGRRAERVKRWGWGPSVFK
jgi:hypothetical protein